jgi:hypothetical protein
MESIPQSLQTRMGFLSPTDTFQQNPQHRIRNTSVLKPAGFENTNRKKWRLDQDWTVDTKETGILPCDLHGFGDGEDDVEHLLEGELEIRRGLCSLLDPTDSISFPRIWRIIRKMLTWVDIGHWEGSGAIIGEGVAKNL